MSNVRPYRRNLSLALALVAMTISQTLYPVANARTLNTGVAADLTAEKQTLTSFSSSLKGLEKRVIDLQLRSSITSSELNSTKTSATTLKTQVSQVQQAVASIIRKLKASGEWQNYDATVNGLVDPKAQKLLAEIGGAKRLLEDFAVQAVNLPTEIDSLVQPLNSRVASSGFSPATRGAFGFMPASSSFAPATVAATSPAAPVVTRRTARCILRVVGYVVLGGMDRYNGAECACYNDTAADVQKCDASNATS